MRHEIGVAVVGAGFVGPHHVDAVRRGGFGDVLALVGTEKERAERRAKRLGVAVGTDRLDAVLDDPEIHVVHICTPNDSHAAIGLEALNAGKHIVVEKPLTQDPASAWELVEAAARNRRHAMVSFTYRGYPMVRRARQMVEAGELGHVWLVRGSYLQDWLAHVTDYNWRVNAEIAGPSRAVADIGCHVFDTIEWVTGQRVESLMADLATFIPVRHLPAGADEPEHNGATGHVLVDSEDAASILLRFEGGGRGVIMVSQVTAGRKNALGFEIAGSLGSLRWEQERAEELWLGSTEAMRLIQRSGEEPDHERGIPPLPSGHPEGWGGALRDLLRPFYQEIERGHSADYGAETAPYPTLADGARAVSFVDVVLRSSKHRQWEQLAPVGAPRAQSAAPNDPTST